VERTDFIGQHYRETLALLYEEKEKRNADEFSGAKL